MRVSRQWRNLENRKQSGFGHDVHCQMRPGDLAIFCPACPQPSINLPDNWQDDPDRLAVRVVLMFIICIEWLLKGGFTGGVL